ncbi:MAG TPA: hypothetical protein VK927_09515, partial [Adhaeribacter sp.]|nr:hypothetical protein [Adhaeribacter sp.]
MRKSNALFIAGAFMIAFSGCDSFKTATDETTIQTGTETTPPVSADDMQPVPNAVLEKNGLKLTSFDDSPKFASAGMRMVEPAHNSNVQSGPVNFVYDITNFQLTKMTGHEHGQEMANSEQGQHIHNIINNEPYTAHYETSFSKDVKEGNHVVLSFLS